MEKTSWKAIVSIVLGIVFIIIVLLFNILISILLPSIGLIIIVFSILGLVLGIIALKDISRDKSVRGKSFAVIGVILNSLAIILQIITVIGSIFLLTQTDAPYIINDIEYLEIDQPFKPGGASGSLDAVKISVVNNNPSKLTIISTEVKDCGINSTTYEIMPGKSKSIRVYCNPNLEHGTWVKKDVIISYTTQKSSEIQKAKGKALFHVSGEFAVIDNSFILEQTEFEMIIKEKIIPIKEQATSNKDINFCMKIIEIYQDEAEKISMHTHLANIEGQNLTSEEARKFHDDYVTHKGYLIFSDTYDSCIIEVAVLLNKEILCAKATLRYGINRSENLDLEDINLIYNYNQRNDLRHTLIINCIKEVILENYDEDCRLIEARASKETCVKESALKKDDALTCAKIRANRCIYDIALKNKDSDICSFINDGGIRDYCEEDIDRILKNIKFCRSDGWSYINRTCT